MEVYLTIQEFLDKNNGKYVEVAGTSNALNQCVDLANAYLRDVLNQPIVEWTNAKDFPLKIGDKFEYILNTPTNVPIEGDLIVWDGGNGHIAIFIEGDANTFRSYDQNYPTGSPCHIQQHNYSSVTGWLRFKGNVNTVAVEKAVFENLVRGSTIKDKVVDKLHVADNEAIILAEIDKLLTYEDTIRKQEAEKQAVVQQVEDMKADALRLQDRVKGLQDDNVKMQDQLATAQKDLATQTKLAQGQELALKDVSLQLEELKKVKPLDQYKNSELFFYLLKRFVKK